MRHIWQTMILSFSILFCLALTGCWQDRFSGFYETKWLGEEPEIVVDLGDTQWIMPLEEYVAGVVAGEMKPDWHVNAYGAQAIIARTFALSYLEENDTDTISADFAEAQAYKPEQVTPDIRDAVQKTRGQVALYGGEYIWGWFHASAGGRTSLAKVGLGFEEDEPPYTHSVTSPDNLAPSDVKDWEVYFTAEEVQTALANAAGQSLDSVTDISPTNHGRCGRPADLIVTTTSGDITVSASAFRNEIGSEELKSTLFDQIRKEEGGFVFTGSGFGHGVGLSQWGALAMARRGNSPQDIVRYYFRGIHITSVYS